MPIQRCKLKNGKQGWRWGSTGTCYASKEMAQKKSGHFVEGINKGMIKIPPLPKEYHGKKPPTKRKPRKGIWESRGSSR
jgi:hypothetical protein